MKSVRQFTSPERFAEYKGDRIMADATLKAVRDFFNDSRRPLSLTEFKTDWANLSEQDREQLKAGIGNETLTY
jgi:hypothetical protein